MRPPPVVKMGGDRDDIGVNRQLATNGGMPFPLLKNIAGSDVSNVSRDKDHPDRDGQEGHDGEVHKADHGETVVSWEILKCE